CAPAAPGRRPPPGRRGPSTRSRPRWSRRRRSPGRPGRPGSRPLPVAVDHLDGGGVDGERPGHGDQGDLGEVDGAGHLDAHLGRVGGPVDDRGELHRGARRGPQAGDGRRLVPRPVDRPLGVAGDADRPGRRPGRGLDLGGADRDPPGEDDGGDEGEEDDHEDDQLGRGRAAVAGPAGGGPAAHPTTRSTGPWTVTRTGTSMNGTTCTTSPSTLTVTVSAPRSTSTSVSASPPVCSTKAAMVAS